jgi:hypothetical protein
MLISMNRMSIPADVKLALRQEAGFGCCKCGHPLIEYHRIIPWEIEHHNRPEDMMCLCPTHHSEIRVTRESEQRAIKLKPVNIEKNKTKGSLFINQESPIILLGGNTFITQGNILQIDNESIISLRSTFHGNLSLSIKLFNEIGQSVLEVIDNEWKSGDFLAWDIEYKLNFLKIRDKLRSICLEIDARHSPIQLSGCLWYMSQKFLLDSTRLIFDGVIKNATFVGCEFTNCQIFINTKEQNLQIRRTPNRS